MIAPGRRHLLGGAIGRAWLGAALALGVVALPSPRATASGLFVPGHGVRALGRAGAFVAGGDDPSGIWYNPAAIAASRGIQLLADAALIFYTTEYGRVDSGGNSLPTVRNEGPLIPIPTIAASAPVWREKLWAGLSLSGPYSPVLRYPRPTYDRCERDGAPCLDTVARDSPQRYSLVSQEGTKFMELDLALAAKLTPQLIVAVSLQNMFVEFDTLSAISTFNGFLSSGPEDPELDALCQMKMSGYFNPSARLGLSYRPHPLVQVGVAVQLPFWVRGEAEVSVELPVSSLYSRASVEGQRADVRFMLPLGLKAGVEVRPAAGLRLELGLDWDEWSLMQAIVVRPRGICILHGPAADRYCLGEIQNALYFRDTFDVRLGGEYAFATVPLALRAGYLFELGAVRDERASVLSMDMNKHMLTVGASYTLAGFRFDLVFARSFSATRTVGYGESQAMQINPVSQEQAVGIGGGTYRASFTLVGVGIQSSF